MAYVKNMDYKGWGIKERGEGGTYFTFCNSVKELQTSLWTSLGIQDLLREEGSGGSNVLYVVMYSRFHSFKYSHMWCRGF
jgi:hypothetical protein